MVLFAVLFTYIVLSGFIEPLSRFAAYSDVERNRGMGRFLLTLVSFVFFFFVFNGGSRIRFYVFYVSLFCFAVFILTPYAHRIFNFMFFYHFFIFVFVLRAFF